VLLILCTPTNEICFEEVSDGLLVLDVDPDAPPVGFEEDVGDELDDMVEILPVDIEVDDEVDVADAEMVVPRV